jgi:hypothetical protein
MTTKPLIGNFNSVGDASWAKSDGTSLGSLNATTGAWTFGVPSTDTPQTFNGYLIVNGKANGDALINLNATGAGDEAGIAFQVAGVNKWAIGRSPGESPQNFNFYNYTTSSINGAINAITGTWAIGSGSPLASGPHYIQTNEANNQTLIVRNLSSGSGLNGMSVLYPNATPNDGVNNFIYCSDSVSVRFRVRNDGGISNFQTYDTNLSDQRLKTNIVGTSPKLDFICSLQVKDFEYKDSPGKVITGLIAQDVELLNPLLVQDTGALQEVDGEEFSPKAIRTTEIYHMMIKAIQELKAELDAAKARITELEGI